MKLTWLLCPGFFCLSAWNQCAAADASTTLKLQSADMASTPDPLNLTRSIIAQLSHTLSQPRDNLEQWVEESCLPHMAIELMVRRLVGAKNYQATPENLKQELLESFAQYLTSTLKQALTFYDEGQAIKIRAKPGHHADARQQVIQLTFGEAPAVFHIQLYWEGVEESEAVKIWKIIEFSIEDYLFVATKKSEWSECLAQGGIASLLQLLKQEQMFPTVEDLE